MRAWKETSKTLVEKYSGDPRNITARPSAALRVPLSARPEAGELLHPRHEGNEGSSRSRTWPSSTPPVDKQVARLTVYIGVLRLKRGTFRGPVCNDPLRSLIQGAWRGPQGSRRGAVRARRARVGHRLGAMRSREVYSMPSGEAATKLGVKFEGNFVI